MKFPRTSANLATKIDKSRLGPMKYKPGIPGFLDWVRIRHPQVWQAAQSSPTMAGLGADDAVVVATSPETAKPGTLATIISAISDTASKLLPVYQQQVEFKTQLARAQAGQPPLDLTNYTGNAGYRVGLTSSTSNTFLIIGGVLAATLLGMSFFKHRSGKARR